MDEEQRSRRARTEMEAEAEQAGGPSEPPPEARPPSPGPAPSSGGASRRPPQAAWIQVALVLGLPLVGFFIARLSGLLVGTVIAAVLLAALRLGRRS